MEKKKKIAAGELPEAMVTEILARLPVKSLLICKSVCKAWINIISNPHFVKSHLQHANIIIIANPTLLTLRNSVIPLVIHSLHQDDADDDWIPWDHYDPGEECRRDLVNQALLDINGQDLSNSPVHSYRLVMPHVFEDFEVISTYNGIICLSNMSCDVVYLWNPSLKQCKKLPSPTRKYTSSSSSSSKSSFIWFGYDSISDDYKVIRFAFIDLYKFVTVQVYSSNADSWREFGLGILIEKSEEYTTTTTRSTIVVNGILYVDIGDKLLSFDLHNEVFGQVPFHIPPHRKRSDVMDFQGSLAIVFESRPGIDLWTLEYHSGHVSWTKQFSIDEDPKTGKETWLSCYLGAGQFYGSMSFAGGLLYDILYDYEKRETKYYGLEEKNVVATLKYTETLVSLQGFEQVE